MRGLMLLTLRQMLEGKKIWFLGLFLSLPVLLLFTVRMASGFDIPDEVAAEMDQELGAGTATNAEELGLSIFLYALYPQSLCLLACLIYGAALLAGEIEDKTLVYLFTRAQARWKILVGKYLVTAAALACMVSASMTLSFFIAEAPIGFRLWLALLASITGACFAFTAVYALLGLLVPRRAIAVGVIYGFLVEFILSTVPAVINEATVSYYLRALAYHVADWHPPANMSGDVAEVTAEVTSAVGSASLPTALFALVLIPTIALTISGWIVHRREWPLTEGV